MKNHTNLKSLALLMVSLFTALTFSVSAQEKTLVKGQVFAEDGAPLPGVSVIIQGAEKTGTATNVDGEFSLNVSEDAVLSFSFIGYATQLQTVGGRSFIKVTLKEEMSQLDEVVIVGYGEQKKSHLTGAVSKVKNESLDQIPVPRVDEALSGQVSGVNIQATNPEAGGAPTIRIRGVGSITGSSNPLVVIDGVVMDDGNALSSVDMNDVQSVEVLKDAASSAIYGSRAANGVIMITTKGGKEGPTVFSYNGFVGVKEVPKNDVLTTVADWEKYTRDNNNGEIPENMVDRFDYMNRFPGTDWEREIMDGGIIHSHNVAARGGTANTKYSASLGYLKDEGVLLTDDFEKFNFRLNLDTKVGERVNFGIKLNPSYTKQRRFPIGLHDAIRQSPWLPGYVTADNIKYVNRLREGGRWADAQIGDYTMERMFDDYDLAGDSSVVDNGTTISTTSNANPLAKILERRRSKYETKIFGSSYLKFKIANGLNWKSSLSMDYINRRDEEFFGVKTSRNAENGTSARDRRVERNHLITDHLLTYNKEIGKHSINAVGGFAYEYWAWNESVINAVGYTSDYIQTIPAGNVSDARTYAQEKALVSFLGRVNYSYEEKYLASLSWRTDGSSKFGSEYKYGIFPAASVGWRVSEEAFLKGNDVLSNLKLRMSYGETGSDGDDGWDDGDLGVYPAIGEVVPVGAVLNGSIINGYNLSKLSNSELRWEKSIEFNPGIDIGLFRDKLRFSVDVYRKTSEDLLLNQPIPATTGFIDARVNLGKVRNEGIEVEIGANPIKTSSGFEWAVTGNASYNKNILMNMAGANGLVTSVDPKRPAEWIAQEGYPVASFYGYVVDKEIPLKHIKNPYWPVNGESQDIYVKDLNGDGVIDPDDRTILGSPFPKFIWSITNSFNYKGFDFSFMFQGSHGAKVRNMDPQYVNNQFSSNQDFITDPDDPNVFPDPDKVQQRIFTNDIVMDASYVALRNLNLGYTIPSALSTKVGLKKARVYVAANNLLYITSDNYKGYNPEGVNQGLESPLTYGYQRGALPIYRTWSTGVNISF